MASSASLFFDTIFNWDGAGTASSNYTDVTLEAQSPAGTTFDIFDSAAHYLYLGHAEKFDMAIFDLDTFGSLGSLTWQYSIGTGTGWTTFTPASGRYNLDPDDDEGKQYDFTEDGIEQFPSNTLSGWAQTAHNSTTKYWVRVTAATVAANPTVKRIQMRPINAYCTTGDVFRFMQLNNILGGTDFTTTTIPSKETVEDYIIAAQSFIDFTTRKSWRPSLITDEYHQFNLNGFKPQNSDIYKILSVEIWSGASWDKKEYGRKNDFFYVPDTGMVHFSRYFLLPARFASYNAPVWRWGGGEFTQPIKISYLAGRDIHVDQRESGIITEAARKLAAINIIQSGDFGNLTVSGADRIMAAQRAESWSLEVQDELDRLKAFEVF